MSSGEQILLEVGRRIRIRRQELKLTQEQLAFETNFDRTYISLVERGKRNLSLLNLLRFAKALQCSAKDLIPEQKHAQ